MFHLIGRCAGWQLVVLVCFLQILPRCKATHIRCVWLLKQAPVRSIWTKEPSQSLFCPSSLLNYPWLVTSVSPEQMDHRHLALVHASPGPQVWVGPRHHCIRILKWQLITAHLAERVADFSHKRLIWGSLEANCWSSVQCMTSPGQNFHTQHRLFVSVYPSSVCVAAFRLMHGEASSQGSDDESCLLLLISAAFFYQSSIYTEGGRELQGSLQGLNIRTHTHTQTYTHTHTHKHTTECCNLYLSKLVECPSLGEQYRRGLVTGEWVHHRRGIWILTVQT